MFHGDKLFDQLVSKTLKLAGNLTTWSVFHFLNSVPFHKKLLTFGVLSLKNTCFQSDLSEYYIFCEINRV